MKAVWEIQYPEAHRTAYVHKAFPDNSDVDADLF